MKQKLVLQPGPDHPIDIEPCERRVVVKVAGRTIADSRNALVLREASYPPVTYIPRDDVDMSLLEHSDHSTYCPFKGEAAYFSIHTGGNEGTNAVWTDEAPYDAVSAIKGHLAFYADRVAISSE